MRTFYFILLLSATIAIVFSDCSDLEQYFFIRNKASGLVLDSADRRGINLQVFNQNSETQRFQLKPSSRPGLFNIINTFYYTKGLVYVPVGGIIWNEVNVTVDYLASSIYQEWFLNADGTIINGGFSNYGLTVDTAPEEGAFVVLATINEVGPNQVFELTDHIPIEI